MDDEAKDTLRRHVQTFRTLHDESARQAWATNQKTVDAVATALASVPHAEVRTFVALVYAAIEVDALFSLEEHDIIMRRETLRFAKKLDAHLAGVSNAAEFSDDLRRASRFYRAWIVEDRRFMAEATREFEAQTTEISAPDLPDAVASIARRAFWDVIRANVREGQYDSLLNVLQEMQDSMMALIAHSPGHQDNLRDHFDVDWIRQQLAHNAFDESDARRLMEYLAQTIRDWHAPGDADVAADFAIEDTGEFWSCTLIDFLAQAHMHLGHIYSRIVEVSASSA